MRQVMVGVLVLSSVLTGCATLGFTSNQANLLKTASFDHNCPKEQIKVLAEQEEGIGVASFRLDVCGTTRIYKRAGTSFYDADKGSPMPGAQR